MAAMLWTRRSLVGLLPGLLIWPGGQARADALTGRVLSMDDFGTLFVDGVGEVVLAGLAWPQVSQADHAGQEGAYELLDRARAELTGALLTADPLAYPDRFGRPFVRASMGTDSVQEKLLRLGLARYWPETALQEVDGTWRAAEDDARTGRIGLWRLPAFADANLNAWNGPVGRFIIGRGVVRAVAERRDWTYINFGEDWRRDATIAIARRYRRRFDKINLPALQGQRVEARGFVIWRNGPMLELDDPAALRLIT